MTSQKSGVNRLLGIQLKSKLMSNSAKLMSSNFVSLSADGIEEVPEPDTEKLTVCCIHVYVYM